ncbi:MAG: dTMP kinase [Hyperthermus sp.]|nr:MAG: dTMP kinase [Hyperthermus sp.]
MGSPMGRPGIFIAIEGIDGSGVSTHSYILTERLRHLGIDVVYTKEPSRNIIGSLLRDTLQGLHPTLKRNEVLALLFAADRFLHLYSCFYTGKTSAEDCILAELVRGRLIVSDRYKYSSFTYQASKSPLGFVPENWIESLNWFAPPPHILIYLDVPPSVAWRRIKARSIIQLYEVPEWLKHVKQEFNRIMERYSREPEYCPGSKNPHWLNIIREFLSNIGPEDLYPRGLCYPIIVHVKGVDNNGERAVNDVANDIEAAVIFVLTNYLSRSVGRERANVAKRIIEASRKRGLLTIHAKLNKTIPT